MVCKITRHLAVTAGLVYNGLEKANTEAKDFAENLSSHATLGFVRQVKKVAIEAVP